MQSRLNEENYYRVLLQCCNTNIKKSCRRYIQPVLEICLNPRTKDDPPVHMCYDAFYELCKLFRGCYL